MSYLKHMPNKEFLNLVAAEEVAGRDIALEEPEVFGEPGEGELAGIEQSLEEALSSASGRYAVDGNGEIVFEKGKDAA